MSSENPLQTAKKCLGTRRTAEICCVSYEAARKWYAQGYLPRTEWTGETSYSQQIAANCPGVTVEGLLSVRPAAPPPPPQQPPQRAAPDLEAAHG